MFDLINAHTLEPISDVKYSFRQPRTDVTAVYLKSTHKIIIFGGNLKDDVRTDLIEELDLKRGTWRMFPISLERRMSGMSSILTSPSTVYLVGGSDGKTSRRDMFMLDLT